jgi:hypothetical protein
MRAVIVGLDFVYDSVGNLLPIEMNTNIGYPTQKVENDSDIFDMTEFQNFVTTNGFLKVTYIGSNYHIRTQIEDVCTQLSLEFDKIPSPPSAITVPYVEDSPTHLVVRTAFDTTAILDDLYCKNKVNYLNLIKDSEFGQEFAYINDEEELINHITSIPDNGIHPNFILKAVEPAYNRNVYPKFYKVSNQTELDVILQNVTSDYFLMPFYFNETKLHSGKITKIRKISMLFPPNLESIHIGAYTDLSIQKLNNNVVFDANTFEINSTNRSAYFTTDFRITSSPKLMDDDYVIMADGTTKSGLDLQVGDLIKTIDIPNVENINNKDILANYQINMETFLSGVTYSTNKVTNKQRIDVAVDIAEIGFDDGTDWFDTLNSSYLVYENNEIKFKKIKDFVEGDIVLLINTSDNQNVQIQQKIVQTITVKEEELSGWTIGVERAHLFLTSATPNNTSVSYFAGIEHFSAIEHNCSCFCFSTVFGSISCRGCGKGQSCNGCTCVAS